MDKYLAVSVPSKELTAIEVSSHLRNNYALIAKENLDMAFVSPYVIFTDGKEVIAYENIEGEIEIGFRDFLVKKSDVLRKGDPQYFDKTIDSAILVSPCLSFSDIKTREEITKVNKPNDPPGKESDLSVELIHPHATNRALFSLDKKFVFPIYFLVFPNNRLVKFLSLPNTPAFTTIQIASLTKTGTVQYSLSSIAKQILIMIGVGEIVLPIVSESDDVTR